jgi:hypothetical protein
MTGIGIVEAAVIAERERIVKLLGKFWCGEPECTKHPVRMDWVIAAIREEN